MEIKKWWKEAIGYQIYPRSFLDTNNDKLLQRYKFTRRQHPFLVKHKANTLEEAIEKEREYFNEIKGRASIHRIDTTNLASKQLKKQIEEYLKLGEKPAFSISFVSFGFKNGVKSYPLNKLFNTSKYSLNTLVACSTSSVGGATELSPP